MRLDSLLFDSNTEKLKQYIQENSDDFFREQYEGITPPLHASLNMNNVQITRVLLENGANPNVQTKYDNMSALMIAAWNQSVESVRLLLEYGANPNVADKDKWTPLFHAAYRGNVQIVELLLAYGANPRMKDIYGKTPKNKAQKAGHSLVSSVLNRNTWQKNIENPVKYIVSGEYSLLENWILEGNPVNRGDSEGSSILHLSAKNGNLRAAELLLSYGANINRQDMEGNTPLHVATKYSQPELIQLFLCEPACLSVVKNLDQKIPAEMSDKSNISDLFKSNQKDQLIKNGVKCKWHKWVNELYESVHIQESELMEIALSAGLKNDMDMETARHILIKAETPEAIGLAFALNYFKVADFGHVIHKHLWSEKEFSTLGNYIRACIFFDTGRKNNAWVLLQILANKDYSPACVTLAGLYKLYNTQGKNNEVFELFKKAAERDNRKAMMELSKCYLDGYGTKQDYGQAVRWGNKAVQNGMLDPLHMSNLNSMIRKTKISGGQLDALLQAREDKG